MIQTIRARQQSSAISNTKVRIGFIIGSADDGSLFIHLQSNSIRIMYRNLFSKASSPIPPNATPAWNWSLISRPYQRTAQHFSGRLSAPPIQNAEKSISYYNGRAVLIHVLSMF